MQPTYTLRARSRVGKYRIERRIASGSFSAVYQARDLVEGIDIALKQIHSHHLHDKLLTWFRHEARVHATLDHPNILPLKNAEIIDQHLLLAYPLGERSLAERLQSRLTVDRFIDYAQQMLEAVAYAHSRAVVHCDLKPENFIVFPGDRLRLCDFGIAKLARRTLRGSGSGTLGFIAPEQAMGRPSLRSDVFSLGLIFWQMLTGELPEWPFDWPPPAHRKLQRRLHPDFIDFLRRAMQVDPRKRFASARPMLSNFVRLKPRLRRFLLKRRPARAGAKTRTDWQQLRFRQFRRKFRAALELDRECGGCGGPVAESMAGCPWCGVELEFCSGETSYPSECPRCQRGRKLDWNYCGWCYGPGFEEVATRSYSDRRYEHHCDHATCQGPLTRFMRYCPWCRRKTRRNWKIQDSADHCHHCGWGVVGDYWDHCPWCQSRLE